MDESLITTPAALDAVLRSQHEERVERLRRDALAPRLPARDRVLIGVFGTFAFEAVLRRKDVQIDALKTLLREADTGLDPHR